ncbi:MAG TPA: putative baseplate assembly protein [Polyangiaceae bacterium]|nr:putative baseplate assembly protein [Polyangiaceae bacterium]
MALPDIQLDDRRFEEMFQELRRRIPGYLPEWTDHSESDPGITMLQLFTLLEEMVVWRLNRVPDKNYLKFLELVGMEPLPPAAAEVDLTFKLSFKNPAKIQTVEKGSQVGLAEAGDGPPVIFETDEDLHAVAIELRAVQAFGGAQFELVTDSNRVAGKTFQPFGADPQAGAAFYVGFSEPFPEIEGKRYRLRVYAAEEGTGGFLQAEPGATAVSAPPVIGVWEYSTASSSWTPLGNPSDSTLALSKSGWLEFDAPQGAAKRKLGMLLKPEDPELFWIRLRIVQLLGSGYERVPVLEEVALNTVRAVNAITERDELVGASNGRPAQKFRLAHSPILPKGDNERGIVEVDEGRGFELWEEVKDFGSSARDAKHYVLNRSTGEIQFGDGERGKIPRWLSGDASNAEQADRVNIRVRSYRWGAGARGNAGSKKITSLLSAVPYVESVTNLRPATGGDDEETVEKVKVRAPKSLKTANRAVTAQDFKFLAEQTPGAQIARAQAFANHHPQYRLRRSGATGLPQPEVSIPGVVTVYVVPRSSQARPMPSEETLRLVARHLDQHRLLTAELYVAPPRYRKVEVRVTVVAKPTATQSLEPLIKQRLLDYFHPLSGGLEGKGWDFGGTIYFSEIYRQILTMEGVFRIEDDGLLIFVDDQLYATAKDIPLEPDELVFSEQHIVTVRYA